MEYKVVGWSYCGMANTACNLVAVDDVNDGIKQAVVNDIRAHGYLFDEYCEKGAVLNSGEILPMSDELCKELFCRAYGFCDAEFDEYIARVKNEPEEMALQDFSSDCPMRSIVWVKDAHYDMLKNALLSGDNNLEILPHRFVSMHVSDIFRFEKGDEQDYFEICVSNCIHSGTGFKQTFESLEKTDAQSILNAICENGANDMPEPIGYRYENMPAQCIIEDVQATYVTCDDYGFDFGVDFGFDVVLLDKNIKFEPTVFETPCEIALDDEIFAKIKDEYDKCIAKEQAELKARMERLARLKEKMKNKKVD